MMRLIFSTRASNLTSEVSSNVIALGRDRSHHELLESLRSSFLAAKRRSIPEIARKINGDDTQGKRLSQLHALEWTTCENSNIFVPTVDWSTSGLVEDRSQYEITVKLFYLQKTDQKERGEYIENAISLVSKKLKVNYIDLIIVAFPSTSSESSLGPKQEEVQAEEIEIWESIENLHRRGMVKKLGVADFGSEKLAGFLERVQIRPCIDQIKVGACCNVPPKLLELAKVENIELLTHQDSSDILPSGSLNKLLGCGEEGVGFLLQDNSGLDIVRNEVSPKWVIKYTAVVRDRGVIENRGYFAFAELSRRI